jgi:hypothetical protein
MQNKNFFVKKLPTTIIFNGLNFLGEKLSEEISKNGGNVLILDSVTKKNSDNIRKLKTIKESGIKGEIKVIDTLSEINIDEIINSIIDIGFCIFISNFEYDQELDIDKNVKLLDNFFEISKYYNSKSVVTININKKENSNFNNYEEIIENKVLKEMDDLNISLIRIADVYGERIDVFIKSPINMIIESIKKEEVIKVRKEHSFSHYIYIDDAVSGIFNILFSQKKGDFSLSNKEDISNISLAFRISDLTGFPVVNSEPRDRKIEDRIKNPINILDNWEVKTNFEEGIRNTIEYKLSNMLNNSSSIDIEKIKNHIDDVNLKEVIEDNKVMEKEKIKDDINIHDFDNIKNAYLKDRSKIDLRNRSPKGKKFFYFITFIAIILFIFIVYIGFIVINYENSKSYIYSEEINFGKENIGTLATQNSKLLNSEKQTVYLLGIISPVFKYIPIYNNFYKTFQISVNTSNSINNTIIKEKNINTFFYDFSNNNNISAISSLYNLTNLNYQNSQIKKLQSLQTGFKTSFYTYLEKLSLNNKNLISENNNNLDYLYEILSGNKNYMLVFYNSPEFNSGNVNIVKYEYVLIKNGSIVKTIFSVNSGDLNSASKNLGLIVNAKDIANLSSNAFGMPTSGVFYINNSIYNKITSYTKNPNFIKGIIASNNKIFILNLLKTNLNKNIYYYMTNQSISNINGNL